MICPDHSLDRSVETLYYNVECLYNKGYDVVDKNDGIIKNMSEYKLCILLLIINPMSVIEFER